MAKFNFCIASGADGFLPDHQEYVSADNEIEAFDAIQAQLELARDNEADGQETSFWRMSFQQGLKYPDASMWNFRVWQGSDTSYCIDVIGMTQADFDRESADFV